MVAFRLILFAHDGEQPAAPVVALFLLYHLLPPVLFMTFMPVEKQESTRFNVYAFESVVHVSARLAVKLYVPCAVGVPERTPVALLRQSPVLEPVIG